MWTRGWRTSLPRGSSQRSCRKPWAGGWGSPAPTQHTPLVPVPKGCWGETSLLTAGTQLGRGQGQGWWDRDGMRPWVVG